MQGVSQLPAGAAFTLPTSARPSGDRRSIFLGDGPLLVSEGTNAANLVQEVRQGVWPELATDEAVPAPLQGIDLADDPRAEGAVYAWALRLQRETLAFDMERAWLAYVNLVAGQGDVRGQVQRGMERWTASTRRLGGTMRSHVGNLAWGARKARLVVTGEPVPAALSDGEVREEIERLEGSTWRPLLGTLGYALHPAHRGERGPRSQDLVRWAASLAPADVAVRVGMRDGTVWSVEGARLAPTGYGLSWGPSGRLLAHFPDPPHTEAIGDPDALARRTPWTWPPPPAAAGEEEEPDVEKLAPEGEESEEPVELDLDAMGFEEEPGGKEPGAADPWVAQKRRLLTG